MAKKRCLHRPWPVNWKTLDCFLVTEVVEIRSMQAREPDDQVVIECLGCPAGHQKDPMQTVHALIMRPDEAIKLATLLQEFEERKRRRLKRRAQKAV